MDIGKRIIKLRESRDWSQRELAKRVKLNVSVMNRIESGERPVRDHELLAIASVLDVSTDQLLGREEKKTPSLSDEDEFDKWVNDPEVYKFYKEFNESPEERRQALLAVWEILKNQKK